VIKGVGTLNIADKKPHVVDANKPGTMGTGSEAASCPKIFVGKAKSASA
jgi:hypothetical protein